MSSEKPRAVCLQRMEIAVPPVPIMPPSFSAKKYHSKPLPPLPPTSTSQHKFRTSAASRSPDYSWHSHSYKLPQVIPLEIDTSNYDGPTDALLEEIRILVIASRHCSSTGSERRPSTARPSTDQSPPRTPPTPSTAGSHAGASPTLHNSSRKITQLMGHDLDVAGRSEPQLQSPPKSRSGPASDNYHEAPWPAIEDVPELTFDRGSSAKLSLLAPQSPRLPSPGLPLRPPHRSSDPVAVPEAWDTLEPHRQPHFETLPWRKPSSGYVADEDCSGSDLYHATATQIAVSTQKSVAEWPVQHNRGYSEPPRNRRLGSLGFSAKKLKKPTSPSEVSNDGSSLVMADRRGNSLETKSAFDYDEEEPEECKRTAIARVLRWRS